MSVVAAEGKIPSDYVDIGNGVRIITDLHKRIKARLLDPSITQYTGTVPEEWWAGVSQAYVELTPENDRLIAERPAFSKATHAYHLERRKQGLGIDPKAHIENLRKNGLLPEDLTPFQTHSAKIRQNKIDARASTELGPELVGPATKRNMVRNAMKAWQDPRRQIYMSDMPNKRLGVTEIPRWPADPKDIDQKRMAVVDQIITEQMDKVVGLKGNVSWDSVRSWSAQWNAENNRHEFVVTLEDGSWVSLERDIQFRGFHGLQTNPSAIFVRVGDSPVKLEIIDGQVKMTSGKSITRWLEDWEDANAIKTSREDKSIGAHDYIMAFENSCDVMQGGANDLYGAAREEIVSGVHITGINGKPLRLDGAPLVAVRRAGIHVKDDCIIDKDGNPLPRGLLDTILIGAIGKLNFYPELNGGFVNSHVDGENDGKIHIVIPKLRGEHEVDYAINKEVAAAAKINGLDPDRFSIGVMNEEFPTMLTWARCLYVAMLYDSYGNAGFLDLYASLIEANMTAGAFMPMNELKQSAHIMAYNRNTVDAMARAGAVGHAIIGGGMYEPYRLMQLMADTRGTMYSDVGFSNSWSPTPQATLIAMLFNFAVHDPHGRQQEILANLDPDAPQKFLEEMLTMPLAKAGQLQAIDPETNLRVVEREVLDYMQDALGYGDNWVKNGDGASGIADIRNILKMKDFATVRFASILTANYQYNEEITGERILELMHMAATKVQNSQLQMDDLENDPTFKAVVKLVFEWDKHDCGYVEEVLMQARAEARGEIVAIPIRASELARNAPVLNLAA